MSENRFEDYKRAVETHVQAFLEVVRSATQGNLGVAIPVPPDDEGIEILVELAHGLQTIVDELRSVTNEQHRTRAEVEQAQHRAEEALEELAALQRRFSREHWERYRDSEERQGYYLFGEEGGPTSDRWLTGMSEAVQRGEVAIESGSESALALPLNLHGEVIGVVGLSRDDKTPWREEEVDTVTEVLDEVAEALDRQRLLDETQQALIETEDLYQASAELAEAQTYDEVLRVLRSRTLLSKADRSVTLNLFDQPRSGEDAPRSAIPVAQWRPANAEDLRSALLPYPRPTLDLLHPDEPTIITDTESAAPFDDETRDAHSTVAVPLTVGGRWIGYVEALFSGRREFSAAQVRRLMALSGQAAIVIQNLRQLEETWARARRERVLREITDRLRSVPDPEAVTRTAVRELGSALGRPVFIRLGSATDLSRAQGSKLTDNGDSALPEETDRSRSSAGSGQGTSGRGGE
jgi:GAF domain-containing protein